MYSIIRVSLCLVLMSLVACSSLQSSVKRANERTTCIQACQQELKQCNKICQNNCRECGKQAINNASRHYQKFVHEQQVQGGVLARELYSYRDPLQCRKVTCDCSADYTVCTQSCNGLIHKRLQVAPVCC